MCFHVPADWWSLIDLSFCSISRVCGMSGLGPTEDEIILVCGAREQSVICSIWKSTCCFMPGLMRAHSNKSLSLRCFCLKASVAVVSNPTPWSRINFVSWGGIGRTDTLCFGPFFSSLLAVLYSDSPWKPSSVLLRASLLWIHFWLNDPWCQSLWSAV